MKQRHDLDPSAAFSCLLDLWYEFGRSTDDGDAVVKMFLDDWYADETTHDMYEFARQWIVGREYPPTVKDELSGERFVARTKTGKILTDTDIEALADAAEPAESGEPDGYFIIHHRAFGPSCYFGPFATRADADAWHRRVGGPQGVSGSVVPLYRTVDWAR